VKLLAVLRKHKHKMSVLGQQADIQRGRRYVRYGPQPEVRGRAANFTKNVRRNDTAFDGNRCNPRGSIGLAATGANAILQPDLSVYKTAGASLDTLVLDKVDIWANR